MIHGIFELEYAVVFGARGSVVGALQFSALLATASIDASRWLGPLGSVVVGSVVSGGGLLAAGFSVHFWQLCLTQGALVGIGAGISARAAVGIAERRLESTDGGSARRLGLTGAGIGGCGMALGVSELVRRGTTNSALKWLAGIVFCGQAIAAALLYILPGDGAPRITFSAVETNRRVPRAVRWLRLVSHGSHWLAAVVPLVFVARYAGDGRLGGAILVGTLCVGLACGAVGSWRWAFGESLVRGGLCLCVCCLWVPAGLGDGRVLVCVFCGAYGLVLGPACCLAVGRAELLVAAALTMVGVPVAAWITTGDLLGVDPAAALAAACSLASALAAVAADVVASRG